MLDDIRERLKAETQALESAGLLKRERIIGSAQGPVVELADGREMINLCANNYLGLANHPAVVQAAHDALSRYGYGVASVRFICGTQSVHRELEERLSGYLGMEDTILYSSCFDANGGLFETLLDERDAVISDALNHASIIDGIRLCKARRLRYANNDMNELERALQDSKDARVRLIATDGVFSMDGSIAKLEGICDLAERHGALVMVDDSHATGFIGARGRGTHELRGVMDRVDILTGTLGKALGGASGGYVAARKEIVGWLRQRSRPYLFSNSIAPPVAAGTLKVLDLLERLPELRERLHANAGYFRGRMQRLGFDLLPGEHPIVPVMLGEAPLAVRLAERMQEEGVYVVAFSYPVVPHGKARIRTQLSAAHTTAQLDRVVQAFAAAPGEALGIINKGRLMKALVKARAEPGIWMQDVPEPAVGHNDVLIKIHRSAICGTDMHIYNWDAWAQKTIPVPMAVGHEYSGEIVEVGSEVRGVKPGDRVSGEGHITCGHCRNCRAGRRHLCRNTLGVGVNRPGAFAEYLTLPASNVFKLSAGDRRRGRLDSRPVRQCHAHRARFQCSGRGRAHHRRRPYRHHGGRDRALLRRAPYRDHRRQSVSAWISPPKWAPPKPSTSHTNLSTMR